MRGAVKKDISFVCAVANALLFSPKSNRFSRRPKDRIADFIKDDIADLVVDYCEISKKGDEGREVRRAGWVAAFCMAAALEGREAITPLLKSFCAGEFLPNKNGKQDPLKILIRQLRATKGNRATGNLKNDYYNTVVAIISRAKGEMRKRVRNDKNVDFKGAADLRSKWFDECRLFAFVSGKRERPLKIKEES